MFIFENFKRLESYVDVMFIVLKKESILNVLKTKLSFKFEVTNLLNAKKFLGIDFIWNHFDKTVSFILQQVY